MLALANILDKPVVVASLDSTLATFTTSANLKHANDNTMAKYLVWKKGKCLKTESRGTPLVT